MIRNEKAWNILKEDEQLALTLKHGHGKSTWEAGEIMDKAHYKFLEIEARAKKFLRMFTEHFENYEHLIDDSIKLEPRFKLYLEKVIGERKTITETIYEIGDPVFSIMSLRDRIIIEEMERLMKREKVMYRNLALLIMEFDRWNNFRILPKDIQEPSAFKRRNKKNDIKNIKNIWELNTFVVKMLRDRYGIQETTGRVIYIPLPSKIVPQEESIMIARYSEKTISQLSKLGLHVFTKKAFAQEFLDLLVSYKLGEQKHCKEGLKFWPKFRLSSKNAVNYNSIQKRIASRKFLETALKDMDFNIVYPKKKQKKKVSLAD